VWNNPAEQEVFEFMPREEEVAVAGEESEPETA
jgi:hypothetical protein